MFLPTLFVPTGFVTPQTVELIYASGIRYGWVPKSFCESEEPEPLLDRLKKLMNDPKLNIISISDNTIIIAHHSVIDEYIDRLINGEKMSRIPKSMHSNWKFIKFSLSHFPDGHSLHYASEEIRNNPEYMRFALSKSQNAFRFAGPKLQKDVSFIQSIVSKYLHVYRHLTRKMQRHPDIVRQVMSAFPDEVNHFTHMSDIANHLVVCATECGMTDRAIYILRKIAMRYKNFVYKNPDWRTR